MHPLERGRGGAGRGVSGRGGFARRHFRRRKGLVGFTFSGQRGVA